MEQSEEYHNPDPTSSEGEKPEAGEGCTVVLHWSEVHIGGREVGRSGCVGIFGAASLNLV